MKNLFISDLHKKDVNHFTTKTGSYLRKVLDKPFKKLCNIFTNAHIVYASNDTYDTSYVDNSNYYTSKHKNNIIVERYPELDNNTPYIFVANHTCPEDIETILNILDRNAYLILGSIESLEYNKEMYLSFINGMIPFDILDSSQRKLVYQKMKKLLNTNSILIFPEGSHNYNPNKLINDLFDGPVNLSLETNRLIVPITLLKGDESNYYYIDVGNPISAYDLNPNININNKESIKEASRCLRDILSTQVYNLMERHTKPLERSYYDDLEERMRECKIKEAFRSLKWDHDVFAAEYLVKKTHDQLVYEEVVNTLSRIATSDDNEWKILEKDLNNKNTEDKMREHWVKGKELKLKK